VHAASGTYEKVFPVVGELARCHDGYSGWVGDGGEDGVVYGFGYEGVLPSDRETGRTYGFQYMAGFLRRREKELMKFTLSKLRKSYMRTVLLRLSVTEKTTPVWSYATHG
jgi:hypothetical protein